METARTRPPEDLACIAAELLSRWERLEAAALPPPPDAAADCLLCLVKDQDA